MNQSLYRIDKSKIEGEGIFANKKISENQTIGLPLYVKFYIFPIITKELGKKINHSSNPNAKLVKDPMCLKWYLVATRKISKNEEITMNYENTPWFIDGPMPWWS